MSSNAGQQRVTGPSPEPNTTEANESGDETIRRLAGEVCPFPLTRAQLQDPEFVKKALEDHAKFVEILRRQQEKFEQVKVAKEKREAMKAAVREMQTELEDVELQLLILERSGVEMEREDIATGDGGAET